MGMTEAELTQMVGEKKAKEILAQNSTKTKPKKQPDSRNSTNKQRSSGWRPGRLACIRSSTS